MESNIYLGDCLDVLGSLGSGSVDLVVTDPPYLISGISNDFNCNTGAFGVKNRKIHSEISVISDGCREKILEEMVRCLGRDRINAYIWCNKMQIKGYLEFFIDRYDCTFDLLTWHKTNPAPLCSNKYLVDTEYLLFFRSRGVKLYGNYHSKKKWWVSGTNVDDKKKYGHPTCKPVDILETLVCNSSEELGVVLDPFMGSGSTGVACKRHNRRFIGIEIDEGWYNVAKERIGSELVFESVVDRGGRVGVKKEENNGQSTLF